MNRSDPGGADGQDGAGRFIDVAIALQKILENVQAIHDCLPVTTNMPQCKAVLEGCTLKQVAESELHRRKVRSRYLANELADGAAWIMLVDLFVADLLGTKLHTTAVCLGAFVPQTTGLRYLDTLIENGLVGRSGDENDKRVRYVTITAKGRDTVGAVLSAYQS